VSSDRIASLEKLVGTPRDGALLRYGLGGAYLEAGDNERAIAHLLEAVGRDPSYSAAWKLLGRAQAAAGRNDEALESWRRGIETARARGDKQAEKEMTVFAKKLERSHGR
jgi:Tfp pilus assembly protein PilF